MDAIAIIMVTIIGLLLLSIPVMFVVSARREIERRHALQAFAAAHGFTYSNREPLARELRNLEFFKAGTQGLGFSRNIKNIMRGRETLHEGRRNGGIGEIVQFNQHLTLEQVRNRGRIE